MACKDDRIAQILQLSMHLENFDVTLWLFTLPEIQLRYWGFSLQHSTCTAAPSHLSKRWKKRIAERWDGFYILICILRPSGVTRDYLHVLALFSLNKLNLPPLLNPQCLAVIFVQVQLFLSVRLWDRDNKSISYGKSSAFCSWGQVSQGSGSANLIFFWKAALGSHLAEGGADTVRIFVL